MPASAPAPKLPLPCGDCDLPFAKVQNGCLLVVSYHHGQQHTNVITLAQVQEWLRAAGLAAAPHLDSTSVCVLE